MSTALPLQLAQAHAALQAGQLAQALALAQPLADAPQAEISAHALQIMGIALTGLGRPDEAQAPLRRLLERTPNDAAAWVNLARAQMATDHDDEALASFNRALAIDPRRVTAHFNLGQLFARHEAWAQAEASFGRVIDLAPDRPEPYCQRAEALIRLNRSVEAQRVLQTVLVRHPNLGLAWSLLGAAHQKLWQTRLALAYYRKALDCDPTLAAVHANIATLLKDIDKEQALRHAQRAAELEPDMSRVQGILASALIDMGQAEAAYALARRAQQDNDPFSLIVLARAGTEHCDWQVPETELATLRARLGAMGSASFMHITPFVLLRFPFSLAELQGFTQAHAAASLSPPHPGTPEEMRAPYLGQPRPPKLRIGYFSADFHDHATMHLMAGMFEAHDKSRFETIGISLDQHDDQPDDAMRARARQAFDRFESVADQTDDEIAELGRKLGLHIAVDLKGFTQGCRMGIFALRAAPIQMHYIGYPGTLGMPGAIDYLVADRVLVPESARSFYSEKIIELPDSYQVNDRQRVIDPIVPSRLELGLPENAFVFCCFNNNYKITREVFGLWMRLLQDIPGSVLWLLADNDAAARNLKQAARDAGVDAARIVFAQRAKLPQHLARHAQADLFLDTQPYGAHTTASDTLWAGLPVLTCAGETFASRVAASLLTACNLPELITQTPEDYLAQARALARAPARLQAIRQQLRDTRLTVPLFDTERFTRHIEQAYELAWARFAQGLAPDHITVPPSAISESET